MEDLELLVFIVSSCNLLIQIELIEECSFQTIRAFLVHEFMFERPYPRLPGPPGFYPPERLFCQRLSRKVEEKLPKNVNLTE